MHPRMLLGVHVEGVQHVILVRPPNVPHAVVQVNRLQIRAPFSSLLLTSVLFEQCIVFDFVLMRPVLKGHGKGRETSPQWRAPPEHGVHSL